MQRLIGVLFMFISLFSAAVATADNAGKTRGQIDDKYKWDLTHLFKSDEEWKAAKAVLGGMAGEVEKYKGKLGTSADQMYDCLELNSNIWRKYTLLSGYASQLSDQDTRESGPMGMTREIGQLGTKLSAASSYIDPEILAIEAKTIETFLKKKPELKEYAHYIDNIQRLKPHTRSAEVEEVISQVGLMSDTPYDIYGIFKDADMPRPEVELAGGEKVRLDDAAYTFYRAGGSDYAIPLLKNIGVDMTTTEPYTLAFAKMNKIMDEIEAILSKK